MLLVLLAFASAVKYEYEWVDVDFALDGLCNDYCWDDYIGDGGCDTPCNVLAC